ncbi:hypothetical protein [Rhizobium sp. YK2]|uniref:hypothetical protein n=1 Tax=Rhizobium sp. YK2 TaxID=1860096 RepID=UPI00084BEBB3|nr:hypothetical protein [Rhizobium sp. YK2]OED00860.1 hypothetical protein A9Z06_12990 [Rhizobium sp. YK2]
MIEIVQACDRKHVADVQSDDAGAFEKKLSSAFKLFKDRGAGLYPGVRPWWERLRWTIVRAGLRPLYTV